MMSKNRRLKLIERIQEKRESHVITYVVSDRPNSEGTIGPDAVREMYRLLSNLKSFEEKPLDLFIFARDGDRTVPWQMVGMIRQMFKRFNVLVPHIAHGPATMIALGADTIVMGERGELSPVEVLIPGNSVSGEEGLEDRGSSIEDAKALMSLMESFGRVREKQRIDAFLRTIDRLHPLLLGRMHRAVEQSRADCLRLLERRRKRFSSARNRRIVSRLFSDWAAPHRSITRSEAVKEIGLKQVRTEATLEPLFLDLLMLYEEELSSGEPFCPEAPLEHSDREEKAFTGQKIAYMESAKRTRVLLKDIKVEKIRAFPPNIQLDPQIILPSLKIGTGREEEDLWSFIEGWLQSHLPALIEESLDRFRRSLPVTGYKRTPMNERWVDE